MPFVRQTRLTACSCLRVIVRSHRRKATNLLLNRRCGLFTVVRIVHARTQHGCSLTHDCPASAVDGKGERYGRVGEIATEAQLQRGHRVYLLSIKHQDPHMDRRAR